SASSYTRLLSEMRLLMRLTGPCLGKVTRRYRSDTNSRQLRDRQAEPEAGEVAVGIRTDPAAESFHDLLHDRQADACSASCGVARFLDPVEAVEHMRQV